MVWRIDIPLGDVAENKNPTFWIGLGASAGGLEALRGFVRNLPTDLDATYIVAQHMAPNFKSMLSEIIGRETEMPVLEIIDGLTPACNSIYIAPPNTNLLVEDGKVRLVEPGNKPGSPKPSVSLFFKTLAQWKGENAVGIILSGTGSDGADGIEAIKKAGGITIAQDEQTARYASMPSAAMETGCVDLVMSPEEMAAQFVKIIALPRDLESLKASPLSLDAVAELIKLLNDQTRVNFRNYKSTTLQRRIERRMAACKVNSLEEYVLIAKGSREEVQALFKDLLISVTSFFRDPGEFEAIKVHIENIVKTKPGPIRVWIAGTATGEETYSLAILFAEAMGGPLAFQSRKIQIFATDIDSDALEVARRGFYSESALFGQVAPEFIDRYFDKVPSGFTVKKFLREKVLFSNHNTVSDPPFLNVDFISCRNLLIYFQANLQTEAFSRFHYSLVPNGVLFLGKSEAISASEALFRVADDEKHIFFQRPSEKRRALRAHLYEKTGVDTPKVRTNDQSKALTRDLSIVKKRFDSLVKAIGPNAILLNSEMQIMTAYGSVDRYLGFSAGSVDTNAMSLLREPYKYEIRLAVPGVIRNLKTYTGVAKASEDRPDVREHISVYPLTGGADEEVMALVVFGEMIENRTIANTTSDLAADDSSRVQIEMLDRELQITRSNLEQISEELETSNEELQSSNEELQSSNEELQSTNEELETSNEELQSTNEELSTVNEELQVNSQQLSAVNQSLQSILENVSVPMLVVDPNLNITNASRAAETIFGKFEELSLPHISRCKMPPAFPSLVSALQEAIDSGTRKDFVIDSDGYSAMLTIVPHITPSGMIMGAIVLVTDNTEQLKKAQNELQLVFDYVPIAIIVRDTSGVIIRANNTAEEYAGVADGALDNVNYYELFDTETAKTRKSRDLELVKTGKAQSGIVDHLTLKNGKSMWSRVSLILAKHPNSDEQAIYSIEQDITDIQHAEQALVESQKRIEQAVKVSNIGFWDWNIETGAVFYSPEFENVIGVKAMPNNSVPKFEDIIYPADRKEVMKSINEHIKNQTLCNLTFRVSNPKSEYRWIDLHGQAVVNDAGKSVRFLGAAQDVTERRANYFELQDRTEQLAAAARLSGLGYWTLNMKSEKVFWSEEVYKIHGVDPGKYTPTLPTSIKFYHPDDVARVQSTVKKTLASGQLWEFEARIVRPTGEVRYVRSACAPSAKPGRDIEELFGVFWDVTDDRLGEETLRTTLLELSRSNEELNRFSYVCSHDMKEPVRMIESMAGLLVEPDLDLPPEKRAELLERISNNTKRLRGIIDSLLAYSRINASVEMIDVDLDKVLDEILEGLSLVIEGSGAELNIGKLPPVFGAKVHFLQLFQNLIGNALKFNDKEVPKIKVSARSQKSDVVFLVEDNGPGIPTEARDEVFGLFRRLRRRDEVEGTGLGLSIAQKIVEQYNGTIRCVDSKLGGIGFEITIPKKGTDDRT